MVTMFVVYNTSGDFNDDLAILIVHNILAFKIPCC